MSYKLNNHFAGLTDHRPLALLITAVLVLITTVLTTTVSAQDKSLEQGVSENVAAKEKPLVPATAAKKSKPTIQSSLQEASRSAAKTIHSALSKRTDLKWEDKPLSEAMKDLSREFNILIELDQVALVDAGYGPDEPISIDAQGRTLFSTLKSAFTDFNFTFVVINEAMLVTTQDAIDAEPGKYLTLRVFNISKLDINSDDVIRLIENQIDPQSWLETNGGPGTISPITKGDSELLVISQTLMNHMKIEDLFEEIQSASSE